MKDLKGFEGFYKITEDGYVFSNRSNKFLKSTIKPNGYVYLELNINGKVFYNRVHRLVALTYINNPHNKPFVNHLDGVKSNNNYKNLEWCTGSENNLHAVESGISTYHFNVYIITDLKGLQHKIIGSKDVLKFTGISKNTLTKYVSSGQRTRTGYLIERATTIRQRSTPK